MAVNIYLKQHRLIYSAKHLIDVCRLVVRLDVKLSKKQSEQKLPCANAMTFMNHEYDLQCHAIRSCIPLFHELFCTDSFFLQLLLFSFESRIFSSSRSFFLRLTRFSPTCAFFLRLTRFSSNSRIFP